MIGGCDLACILMANDPAVSSPFGSACVAAVLDTAWMMLYAERSVSRVCGSIPGGWK